MYFYTSSNDNDVIKFNEAANAVSKVKTNLSPLRFLFNNYNSLGHADTDTEDMISLGYFLDDQIKILNKALEDFEILTRKFENLKK